MWPTLILIGGNPDTPYSILCSTCTSQVSVEKVASGNFPAAEDYSSFTYWREPIPEITIDIDSILSGANTAGI